jgi:hypothetical protein
VRLKATRSKPDRARRPCRRQAQFFATVYMAVRGARRFQRIPPTKPIYIRISLRGKFLYLTVSMRLTILVITCIGPGVDALQLIVVAFPPCALLCVAVPRANLDSWRRFPRLVPVREVAIQTRRQEPPLWTSKVPKKSNTSNKPRFSCWVYQGSARFQSALSNPTIQHCTLHWTMMLRFAYEEIESAKDRTLSKRTLRSP